MIYMQPDGEKPVLNEKVFQFIPEPAARRVQINAASELRGSPQNPVKTVIPAEKQEPSIPVQVKPEKDGKKISLDKHLIDGMRLYRMKRWDNALQELLLVKAENFDKEEQVELAYYLGLCYTKLEKYDEAPLYLEQVITSGTDVMRVYQCRMTLAFIYIIAGKAKLAEFELNHLQKNGFESASLYNALAYSAFVQKRHRNAVELYEKALELDKNNTTAMNGMGFILSDSGINREKGLKFCRKAVERRPKSAAYLDSLGWAHYRNGNFSEAKSWLSRALEIAPKEKEIKEHYRIITGGRF